MKNRIVMTAAALCIVLLTGCATQMKLTAPEKPTDVTAVKIQKMQKEVFRSVAGALTSLKFTMDKKVGSSYLEGSMKETRILTLTFSANSSVQEWNGILFIYKAEIWLEPLSQNETYVYIRVIEKSYDVVKSQMKSESEKIERSTDLEQKIISSFK